MLSTRNRKRLVMPIPLAITCWRRSPRALGVAPLFPRHPPCRAGCPFPAGVVLTVRTPENGEGDLSGSGRRVPGREWARTLPGLDPIDLAPDGSVAEPGASRQLLAAAVPTLGVTPAASFKGTQTPRQTRMLDFAAGFRGSDDVYSPSRSFHNRQGRTKAPTGQPPESTRGVFFSGPL